MIPALNTALPVRGASPSLLVKGARPCRRLRNIAARSGEGDEIYIGFPKNDYGPREGRKGRVIKDDPKKYPVRDEFSGGWAGGEAGLWKFREEIKAELAEAPKEELKPPPSPSPAPGKKPIYVGFGKDELALKNSGAKGRVIYDDDSKYPDKEDVGFLSGATGGFAGGEVGLKAFAETGQLKLRKPGEPGGQGISPLSVIFLLVAAGGTGAALYLNGAFDEASTQNAEAIIRGSITAASDETVDKTPIYIGLGLVGALGLTVAAKSAVDSASAFVQENGSKYLTYAVFIAAVLLAAKAVIEN